MKDAELSRVIGALVHCQFTKLWKGKALKDFYSFLFNEGLPAKGFVITIPLSQDGDPGSNNTGWAWFWYRIASLQKVGASLRLKFDGNPVVMMPTTTERLRECPEELKGFPKWRYKP